MSVASSAAVPPPQEQAGNWQARVHGSSTAPPHSMQANTHGKRYEVVCCWQVCRADASCTLTLVEARDRPRALERKSATTHGEEAVGGG